MSQIIRMATIAHEHAVIVSVICIHFFLHVICLYRNERSIEKAAAWQHQIRVFHFVIACVIPHIVRNSVRQHLQTIETCLSNIVTKLVHF